MSSEAKKKKLGTHWTSLDSLSSNFNRNGFDFEKNLRHLRLLLYSVWRFVRVMLLIDRYFANERENKLKNNSGVWKSEKLWRKIFTFPDDRVSGLFLVGSFWPITAIIFGYLYFVTGKGQELMRNRQPFELKNIIIVYNLFQIFLCLYIAVGVSWHYTLLSALETVN